MHSDMPDQIGLAASSSEAAGVAHQVSAVAELAPAFLQMYGLNSECDGKVWRVDVGMSSGVLNAEAQACSRTRLSCCIR